MLINKDRPRNLDDVPHDRIHITVPNLLPPKSSPSMKIHMVSINIIHITTIIIHHPYQVQFQVFLPIPHPLHHLYLIRSTGTKHNYQHRLASCRCSANNHYQKIRFTSEPSFLLDYYKIYMRGNNNA